MCGSNVKFDDVTEQRRIFQELCKQNSRAEIVLLLLTEFKVREFGAVPLKSFQDFLASIKLDGGSMNTSFFISCEQRPPDLDEQKLIVKRILDTAKEVQREFLLYDLRDEDIDDYAPVVRPVPGLYWWQAVAVAEGGAEEQKQ